MSESAGDFNFPSPYAATLPPSRTRIEFTNYAGLREWLEREITIWAPLIKDSSTADGSLSTARDELQRSINILESLERIRTAVDKLGEWSATDDSIRQATSSIHDFFRKLENGELICWDSACASRVKELSQHDRDAALFYAGLHMSKVREEMASFGRNNYVRTADALLRTIAIGEVSGAKAQLDQSIEELKKFRAKADTEFSKFAARSQTLHDEEASTVSIAKNHVTERTEEWATILDKTNQDIAALRNGFRTEFALRAPTEYWIEKHSRHTMLASVFAGTFVLICILVIAVFILVGVPLLMQTLTVSSPTLPTSSPTIQSTPLLWIRFAVLLVPGFFFIWILRVVGRLFSTQMNLAEDSAERVTMAKTFLALAGSESGGKLVSDADRSIVLNALFRPSNVTGPDDAPPVNVVELVLNKIKGEGSKP